jgi:hypothetical protein
LPAVPLVVRRRYLIVVPRPLPAATLVVYRRAVFVYRGVLRWSENGRYAEDASLYRNVPEALKFWKLVSPRMYR